MSRERAVFLDRDGVIVEDSGLLICSEGIRILPGVPQALSRLKDHGFALVIITNQAVIARGLLTESQVVGLEREIEARLMARGAPALDGFYVCPHHPKATLPEYRLVCSCRKPNPGLLLQAARELGLDLAGSFMVGDRPTDLLAGARAGCRTIWAQTGQHKAEPIETGPDTSPAPLPDLICDGLPEATNWILEHS